VPGWHDVPLVADALETDWTSGRDREGRNCRKN
jgi:hypothetical protein